MAQNGRLRSLARYEAPKGVYWDDEKYRGEAYATYAWAAYVAEVSVDLSTYSATVEDFVALQEVGKVIHPVLARANHRRRRAGNRTGALRKGRLGTTGG